MKRFIYICSLVFVNLIYSQFTQNIPYQNFIGHNQGGGNQSVVTINSTSISISFNTYFNATNIQNKYVATLNYTGNLPDMTLGPIQNTSYRILIISKKVYIVSDINESVSVLSGTISSNLTGFVPISSADIKTISTVGENFIREIVYLTDQGDSGLKQISTTFFDGLGRPMLQIANQQSATGKNIVTPITYDAYGRQALEYLPYATTTSDLSFIPVANAITEQANFSQYTGQVAFSEKLFEASPLNRVLKQSAPGNDWAMGQGKEIKFDYQTNVENEVPFFTALATWNATMGLYDITINQNGSTNYPANQLYKTIIKDENWTSGLNNTTEEFKDKEGRVILKRTYENNIPHDTYYVYDQFGNLTYVIPPKAESNVSSLNLTNLCYQYKYDYRNRLVEKKLPGKQWEYIVYDKLDRVVATGPVFTPFTTPAENGWMITKYDAFNRPILTGFMPSTTVTVTSADRKTLQDARNLDTILSESKPTTATNVTVNGVAFRYTNVAFPASTTSYHVLTINYYDDYNSNLVFTPALAYSTSITPNPVFYNNTTIPKGLPTMSWVRVPETKTLYKHDKSYSLYDNKGRAVRSFTNNYLGGYTQVDSQLELITGRVNYTLTTHKRVTGSPVLTTREDFTYSPQDRLLTHTHKINTNPTQLLNNNTYDELGQLKSKAVGGTNLTSTTGLQKVDYNYNIRGWLTQINDIKNSQQSNDPVDLFAFKLNYNNVEGNIESVEPLYNGNISETFWRTSNDNIIRKYGYKYDKLNRLKEAIYLKEGSSANSYGEKLEYDKNGNITLLTRYGEMDDDVNKILIDNLTYHYPTNSNLLTKVTDLTNNPSGFKDDSTGLNDTIDDYTYDLNGNMTKDDNKGITLIKYNHLNLPVEISFSGTTTRKINYLYNAIGQKVKKTVTNGTSITHTDYLSGYQYRQIGTGTIALEFFPHSEGYVSNTLVGTTNNYNYIFNYTDHLGNNRLSYTLNTTTNALTIVEENHYYPFGLKHQNYNLDQEYFENELGVIAIKPKAVPFKYKYNGKELQDELGLNFYDYGARNYDPAIGRWMNIDPLAEEGRRWSPYNYAMDNPVYFIDPDGMLSQSFIDDLWNKSGSGETTWTNNDDGTFSNENGDTVEDDEDTNNQDGEDDQEKPKKGTAPDPQSPEEQAKYHQDIVNMSEMFDIEALETALTLVMMKGGVRQRTVKPLKYKYTPKASSANKLKYPNGWKAKPSKKGGGTVYQDPNNPHNSMRVMPGNPNSPNAAQRNPYVIFKKDGVPYNANGQPLKNSSDPASHIPLNQFDLSKMPK